MANNYHNFISEAFIDPVRSVLIIDDEYPTYDEILSDSGESRPGEQKKSWHHQKERIASVIKSFREREKPLLVDIHDGYNITTENEVKSASHLHQCDLLVLDYHLVKGSEDGAQAISILRAVMLNNHFNLVVIYTIKDLDRVFNDIRWSLIKASGDRLSDADSKKANDLISEREIRAENFSSQLSDSIKAEQYFCFRLDESGSIRKMSTGRQPFSNFHALAKEADWNSQDRILVFRYQLMEIEKKNLIDGDSTGRFENLEWSDSDPMWIKSDSVFISLSKKNEVGIDLLSELEKALIDWNPSPTRLILTKLRAEIDEHGVAEQGRVLNYQHASAYWYFCLLKIINKEERRWRVDESVSRYSEQLLRVIQPSVSDFAVRLIDAEVGSGDAVKLCRDRFQIDLGIDQEKEKSILEHNAFVCSTERSGARLTTGHVYSFSDEYWLCLSPVCDMVPGRKKDWRRDICGEERLPFLAIKLHPTKPNTAIKQVNSNLFLFLPISDDIFVYCFNRSHDGESAPHWNMFYAEHEGKFISDFKFRISHVYCHKDSQGPLIYTHEAEVVAQLRYEYALNLVQRLGSSFTRVGLDFRKWDED